MKMTRNVISRTDTSSQGYILLQRIHDTLSNTDPSDDLTGAEACLELFKFARLNQDVHQTEPGVLSNKNSEESQAILKNFHNFHNSWFASKSLEKNGNFKRPTLLIKDQDEPALYFTKALFQRNSASYPVSATTSLRSIRVPPVGNSTVQSQQNWYRGVRMLPMPNQSWHMDGMKVSVLDVSTGSDDVLVNSIGFSDSEIITFGQIIGVKEQPVKSISASNRILANPNRTLSTRMDRDSAVRIFNNLRVQTTNIDLFQHLGGGVLGSQMYILKNTNLLEYEVAGSVGNDPDKKIHRRLAARIFTDLMCHQLPTLQSGDSGVVVDNSSPHTFKKSTSCMRCHASIDPLAYSFRNLMIYTSAVNIGTNSDRTKGTPIFGVVKMNADVGAKYGQGATPFAIPTTGPAYFPLQTPTGNFTYRDHLGNIQSTSVSSLAALGNTISLSDDYYRCMVKRYYNFFTGNDVDLSAPSNYHSAKVYQWADELKTDKNLQNLFYKIFQSDAFKKRNFKGEVE